MSHRLDKFMIHDFGTVFDMSLYPDRIPYRLDATDQFHYHKNLVDLIPASIVLIDTEANILYANQQAQALMGRLNWQLENHDWRQFVHPDDLPRIASKWDTAVKSSAPFQDRCRLCDPQGNSLYVQIEATPQRKLLKDRLTYIVSLQDLSEHKQREQELRQQVEVAWRDRDQLYATVTESVPVGLYRNDAEGKCIYINQKACEILDITFEECLGHGWVNRLHPDDTKIMLESWNQAFATKSFWQEEYRFLHRNGNVVWVLAQCVFTFDAQGQNTGSIGGLTDITAKKKLEQSLELANQKLQKLAHLDGLTAIPNRRYFDEFLAKQWSRLKEKKQPIALLLIDIDHFKDYNDTYGHLFGDQTLKIVAQTLLHVVKSPMALVARYGGEEFAAVLPNITLEGAKEVAREIATEIDQLAIPNSGSNVSSYLTLSIGISCMIPSSDQSINLLIDQADQALYSAKNQGRNRIIF